ncbi:MAG TPA: NAD(P)-dependent oxidoreductase [Cytophagaceae bacterium]|nr:NAD(P)-dependent oxidoreductase [Cytophagaceae bacterium]
MKIGIVRESKIPVDWRVPLRPDQCKMLLEQFPQVDLYVQPSDTRCFSNKEYTSLGIKMKENLHDCDILFGIKEIAEHLLIPHKKYLFFSHTIKKQPQNKKLLQAILEKKIEMIDYECIRDENDQRVIAFGKFAGIVGAYNSLRLYGQKYKLFDLKPAYKCYDYEELKLELKKLRLPPLKIVVTGSGRVGQGICEVLDFLNIPKISGDEFLRSNPAHPVYAALNSEDYHVSIKGKRFTKKEFHQHPERFHSVFVPYTKAADILIAGAFWHPKAPVLFTKEDMRASDFRIKLIGDVTCDFNGSIPCTIKPSTIYDPAYDYNPFSEEIEAPFSDEKNITVMAIENLPGELPRDASSYFGDMLLKNVLPDLFGKEKSPLIERATIARNGVLTEKFRYLRTYVKG